MNRKGHSSHDCDVKSRNNTNNYEQSRNSLLYKIIKNFRHRIQGNSHDLKNIIKNPTDNLKNLIKAL